MRSILLALGLLACTAIMGSARADGPETSACPVQPAFGALQRAVRTLPAAEALARMYRYAADPARDSPYACEGIALDAQIGAREAAMVALRSGSLSWRPAAVYHCRRFDLVTTRCDGIVADGTAQPHAAGMKPIRLRRAADARLASTLPGAKLVGVYRVAAGELLDGGRAARLASSAAIRLSPPRSPSRKTTAIIAIFDAPEPWRYRKLVWYFE